MAMLVTNRVLHPMMQWALAAAVLIGFALSGPRALAASAVVVIDTETGSVLHQEHAGVPWYPASLTKLMTAYVTFQEIKAGRLALDTKIPVSRYASMQAPSKIGLPAGSKISVDLALQAVVVRSANDMAVVLAEGVAGSEAAFVKLMNAHAGKLGMSGTYFVNPHGLPDIRQVTTARDMALLGRALRRQFPDFAARFAQRMVRIGKRRFRNRNGILKQFQGADGMKTGFICDSGYNLVASATREGRNIIAVVLGARSGGKRTQTASKLLEAGFNSTIQSASLSEDALSQNVRDISNWDRLSREPGDLKKVVCKRLGEVRISRWWGRQKWGVVLSRSGSALSAGKAMRKDLLALRNVVYSGKGMVYKEEGEGQYVAAFTSLDRGQIAGVCDWLSKAGRSCERLEPVPHEVVVAKLKAIEKKIKRKRALRRARLKKRRAAARAKRKKAQAAKAKAKKQVRNAATK